MGKVQARDIHTRQDELLEGLFGLARGADRADDFGSSGEHRLQNATKGRVISNRLAGIGAGMFGRDSRGTATFGGASVDEILNEAGCGTPAYLYDLDAIRAAAKTLVASFGPAPHLVAYAAKANSAAPVLRALFAEGCGADVVSGAELELVLQAGLLPDRVVFSGVAKRDEEIDLALTRGPAGILAIQAESVEEIVRIGARARALGRRARLSLRINPGVSVDTHAHVATGHDAAKFGIARGDVAEAFSAIDARSELSLVGLSSHIGSTQSAIDPYVAAARVLFDCIRSREASKGPLEFVDAGGGFGIDYGAGCPVAPPDFVRALISAQKDAGLSHLRTVIEPGRSLVGSFGLLVAGVIQAKVSRSTGRRWLMIDAGMNDLVRPALYQARHRIEAVHLPDPSTTASFRVVGPICESSDDFGEHELPSEPVATRVAIRDAGAYGFTMASNYNGRALPAEVFVSRGRVVGISPRGETAAWIASRLRG
jgi:diaminopimelate decarboxylase